MNNYGEVGPPGGRSGHSCGAERYASQRGPLADHNIGISREHEKRGR
jgi:hypothetical protein